MERGYGKSALPAIEHLCVGARKEPMVDDERRSADGAGSIHLGQQQLKVDNTSIQVDDGNGM